MRRLEIGEKIGCATLVVGVIGVIAAWLSVPGVLQPRVAFSDRMPASGKSTADKPRNSQSITRQSSEIKPTTPHLPTTTSHPPALKHDAMNTTATTDLSAIFGPFRPVYTPARPAPVRMDSLLCEFRSCTYDKKLHTLSCEASVTNESILKKTVTLNCDNTVVVDNLGKGFTSSRCYLGGDDGMSWATDTLVPGVQYKISANFYGIKIDSTRLQYLGFGIGDGAGFKYVPVDSSP